MRNEYETNHAIEQYASMIRRICFYHLKSRADTEDVFQNVFLKYLLYEGDFIDAEHEKAWFIRVTMNACKDHLKSLFRRSTLPLDVLKEEAVHMESEQYDLLEAVLALPTKYKDVIYLHYYEGYAAAEIGQILKTKEGTVYSLLSRGRVMLKDKLRGDEIDRENT